MSVKFGLLALLAEQATYGARLRADFEARTGGTWPLNIGQVYTTLGRLERDGLVSQEGAADPEGRITYQVTETGRAAVGSWWTEPVDRADAPRDELVIKLALAVTAPDVDVTAVVQGQRAASLTHLRDLTVLKRRALDAETAEGIRRSDFAWTLVLENLIFSAESEVRWLDHVEARVARQAVRPDATPVVDERPAAAAHAQPEESR